MKKTRKAKEHNTVYQAVAWNEAGWTKPVDRVGFGGWNTEHHWAGEDWNFALDQAVDGYVYGFGQGEPAVKKAERLGGRFNVVFYSRLPAGGAGVVGVYLNARLLQGRQVGKAWKRLTKAGIVARRRKQLAAAFTSKKRSSAEVTVFDEARAVSWKVRACDVRILAEAAPFDPPGWRYTNLHFTGLPPVEELLQGIDIPDDDLDAAGFPAVEGLAAEGRLRERTHRFRERNAQVIADVKASRPAVCQVEGCGFDFGAHYGELAAGYIEAHHSVPLKDLDPLDGAPPDPSQIVLLCANCHRAAHRTGHLTLEALNLLHKAP